LISYKFLSRKKKEKHEEKIAKEKKEKFLAFGKNVELIGREIQSS
jgi:hypothetical protein